MVRKSLLSFLKRHKAFQPFMLPTLTLTTPSTWAVNTPAWPLAPRQFSIGNKAADMAPAVWMLRRFSFLLLYTLSLQQPGVIAYTCHTCHRDTLQMLLLWMNPLGSLLREERREATSSFFFFYRLNNIPAGSSLIKCQTMWPLQFSLRQTRKYRVGKRGFIVCEHMDHGD